MTAYLPSLVLLLSLVNYDIGAKIYNCPKNQIKFEKVIGLRPSLYQKSVLLYRGNKGVPVTLDCIQTCAEDTNCSSFILYYNTSECYSYIEETLPIESYDYDSRPDTNVVWYRKTCINFPSCSKAWIFETVAGAEFIDYDTKYVGNISRQQCIQRCIQEVTFICRSIKFEVLDIRNFDGIGSCILSEKDRHQIPNSFRVSRYEYMYIENQCITTPLDYWTYEEYDNATLKHDDLLFATKHEEECRTYCDTQQSFNCRSYSVIPSNQIAQKSYDCYLHSEDSKLVGPKLLIDLPEAKYYEKVRTLNVTAICNDTHITITYSPEQTFFGRIYANGYSDTHPCYADGNYNAGVVLQIPLNQGVCGLSEITSKKAPNSILRSILLVIQYNSLIQTQSDRYLRVGCALGNGPDMVTVGTNFSISDSRPNKGSTVINNSTVLPVVTIRVVDYDTKLPTRDTAIGQKLMLIIEIKPGNGPYDIWAGHLVATSENGQDSILLLDDNGCPTQPDIFPAFSKISTNESQMLISTFQAFKFTASSVVRFSVMVHFCAMTCPPLQCPANTRPKREENYITTKATVVPINKTNDSFIEVMPLNFLLIVRGQPGQSEQLVFDKGSKILIAGADWFTNEVCVDYALFVGLAVLWIVIQIIILVVCFFLIRKYKKYFDIAYTRQMDETHFSDTHQGFGLGGENLNRRVRWADQ